MGRVESKQPGDLVMSRFHLTAIIEREGTSYVALCPELDIASQEDTCELARENLAEAIELFLECADESEVRSRLSAS